MKEKFVTKNFQAATLEIIEHANKIVAEYQEQGFVLTLRQLYYQFVSRDLLANTQANYKKLGSIISDARLAGMLDWDSIEDRTRTVDTPAAWTNPESIISACAAQYQENLWSGQPYQPEVWIEKEALAGVITATCKKWRVPSFACRGYASQSSQYEASKRMQSYERMGRKPVILHLGDHDPSGIDMTRENAAKLELLCGYEIEVRRLALNMDQVRTYNPPPNPAKETDIRFIGYVSKFGDKCWELDALEPTVINQLIESAIIEMIDTKKWSTAKAQEERNKLLIQQVAERWDDVANFIENTEEE